MSESQRRAKSDRFYWCSGCGRWHDPLKRRDIHYLMNCPVQSPAVRNFDGTDEELKRFLIACQLNQQDAEAFEERIDRQIKT
jgi:hypothetical protein